MSPGGFNTFGSTLHWGTAWNKNNYVLTHAEYKHTEYLGDVMHVYGLFWTQERLITYIDNESNVVLNVDIKTQSFLEKNGFDGFNQ